jgi:uncharacterized protein YbjT (DUF2867 family)
MAEATIAVLAAPRSRTGQLVLELAERRGHTARWAPVDGAPRTRSSAMRDADAIVLIPARACGAQEMTRHAREQASRRASAAHLLLVSSFTVGHGLRHPLGRLTGGLPHLLEAERILRAGSAPYTIVRPTWLTDDPAGAHAVTLTQDPRADGMLARADLATALVAAVEQRSARGRTFALFNQPGRPPRDWNVLFGGLVLDDRGSCAGGVTHQSVDARPRDDAGLKA